MRSFHAWLFLKRVLVDYVERLHEELKHITSMIDARRYVEGIADTNPNPGYFIDKIPRSVWFSGPFGQDVLRIDERIGLLQSAIARTRRQLRDM